MKEIIKFIFPEDCYPIRLKVLRKGLSIENTKFEGDYSQGSFHLGYILADQIAGILTCNESRYIHIPEKPALQLRGMAVLEEYKGQSIGLQLCKKAEEIAAVFNKEIIWCNARTSALGFYEKQGYKKIGKEFTLPYAGTHYVMYKELKK